MEFSEIQKAASIALYKWMICSDKNTKRLMITHTDLDGYGCKTVISSFMDVMNTAKSCFTSYSHSNPGHSNIVERINTWISWASESKLYTKGVNTLSILITDLANFDPSYIKKLRDDGHIVTYLLIDHHTSNYGEYVNEYSPKGNWENCTDCYYVNEDHSATYLIYELIKMSTTGFENLKITKTDKNANSVLNLFQNLERYATAVSQYDTGHWGEWNVSSYDEVEDSVKEQLAFSYYTLNKKQYGTDRVKAFNSPESYNEFLKKGEEKWKLLIEEYKSFCSMCEDYTGENYIKCKLLEMLPKGTRVKIVASGKDDGPKINYLTLVSKEVLEKDKFADIILLVNFDRMNAELRSIEGYDVSKIALANGGGGHKRASGFPIKEDMIVK